jgi:hypothetical protein
MSNSGNDLNADDLELSDVRFGLRALLLVTTAVAVVSGVLATVYRGLSIDERGVAAVSWSICTAIVVIRIGYCVMTRIRLARTAGNTLFVLSPRGTFGGARRPWVTMLVALFWIVLGLYFMCLTPFAGNGVPMLPILVCSGLISAGVERAWFRRAVRLHVHGVLFGMRLLRWTHVTKHEWDGNAVKFLGLDQRHRDVQIEAVPEAKIREKVAWLIERMSSPSERSELQEMIRTEGTRKPQTLVPINARGEITGRGLAAAAVAYVMFCLIAFGVMGRSGPVSREYLRGLQLGIVAAILKIAYDALREKDTGAPLVRLFLKIDWPSLLVAMLVAIATFYINDLMVFPPIYIAMPLGIVCGLALSVVAGMLFREKLDLCENGIVLVRWPFLPWGKVHVLKWNGPGKGSLLLRSGWRRIRARVLPEHWKAVDQILRAKCRVENDNSVDRAN